MAAPFIPLDDSTYSADQPASALIPIIERDNAELLGETVHAGAGFAYADGRACAVSTPSDIWRTMPIAIPVDESTTSIAVSVLYEAELGAAAAGVNAVEIRLVTPDAAGVASMLTVTAGVERVTVTALYRSRRREVVICELQIRSVRAAAAFRSGMTLRSVDEQGLRWTLRDGSGGTLTTGIVHYEALIVDLPVPGLSSARRSFHVGYHDTATASPTHFAWIWPSSTGTVVAVAEQKFDGEVDIYDVGAITIYGWTPYCAGAAGPLVQVDAVTLQADRYTSAAGVNGVNAALARIYARGRVWAIGVNPTGTDPCLGARVSAGDLVACALCDVDGRGSSGYQVTVLYTAPGGLPGRLVEWTIAEFDPDDAPIVDAKVYSPAIAMLDARSAVQPAYVTDDAQASEGLHGVLRWDGGTGAGWRDLLRSGETLTQTSGFTVLSEVRQWGDASQPVIRVEVRADTDLHVWAVLIAEVI